MESKKRKSADQLKAELAARMKSRESKGAEEEPSRADRLKAELEERMKGREAKKSAETQAEHTVVSGDSLSAIASQYYGSGAKEKWMAIYEANKEIIGDNPSLIRVGQVLKIPKLS
jgi:nucleoid-associated protein YgaU